MIRLLLVYDDCVLLRVLESVLHEAPEMQVVARLHTRSEVSQLAGAIAHDVILIDYDLALLKLLRDANAASKIILFSEPRDAPARQRAIERGAQGVVCANGPAARLLQAIKAVHAGELWVSRDDATALIDELRDRVTRHAQFDELTERQREILDVLCSRPSYPAARLADFVQLSETVLRTELSSIYRTLGVSSHRGLLRYLREVRVQPM